MYEWSHGRWLSQLRTHDIQKKDRPCPNFSEVLSAVVVMPAGIAELWIVGYLLVIGVRSTRTTGVAEEKAPEEVRS
jgi:hypothetical protein